MELWKEEEHWEIDEWKDDGDVLGEMVRYYELDQDEDDVVHDGVGEMVQVEGDDVVDE